MTLLPFLPNSPPNPQIKARTAALEDSQVAPLPSGCWGLQRSHLGSACSASLFQRLPPCQEGELAAPAEGGAGIPDPSSLRAEQPQPCAHPDGLPAHLSLRQNPCVPRRRAVGAVQMLRGGPGRRGRRRRLRPGEAAALAHGAILTARVPLGHGSSGPTGSSPAAAASQPWTLAPSSLWRFSAPEAESRGPVPVRAAEVTMHYSPQLFRSLRFLAMVVQGLVAVRRCHCAWPSPGPQVVGRGRLCARAGRSPLRLRMLPWRWWEGVGRRREERADEPSSASQARAHTNTSVTPSLPRPTPGA